MWSATLGDIGNSNFAFGGDGKRVLATEGGSTTAYVGSYYE